MFIQLKRVIHSAWLGITRNKWLALATILIMVVTISGVTSLFLLNGMVKSLVISLQDKVDVSVYFKPDTSESDILKIKESLAGEPEIKDVQYVSQAEALDRFKDIYKNDDLVMETLAEVGDNPLLASLSIKANQASQYATIANFLQSGAYQGLIEKVNYRETKAVIDRVFSISAGVGRAGIIFGLIFGFIAILVAFNTIRLAIYSMREEIAVMRLVGASNWFIRGPFLFQGIIAGAMATLFTFLLFLTLVAFLGPKLYNLIPDFNLFQYFVRNIGIIILIQFLTGVGLGAASSFIAIRRYLNI